MIEAFGGEFISPASLRREASPLWETLMGMISLCEILNNGVITRKKVPTCLDKVGIRVNNRWRVNISRLVETLMGMISLCEILNSGVIIRTEMVKRGNKNEDLDFSR